MSTARNQKLYSWIRIFTAITFIISLLAGTSFDEHYLSNKAFETLKKNVQKELNTLHKEARVRGELFPGATVDFVLQGGRSAEFATGFSNIEEKVDFSPDTTLFCPIIPITE
ncbi:MAG: hypothetical protein ABXS91_04010 [Sulfurimonas sp.]